MANRGATSSPGSGETTSAPDLNDPRVWDRLIELAGPASLLAFAHSRLGPNLRRRLRAEDLLQEALLGAWRSRAKLRWRGQRAFRQWLLKAIENRARDLAQEAAALKRGGGRNTPALSQLDRSELPPEAPDTVTPGRLAMYREEAEAIRRALGELPDDVRRILELRLIEQVELREVAERTGLSVETVRYRFRTGSRRFRELLYGFLSSGSGAERL